MAPAPASLDPTRASETRTYQLTTTLIVCPIFAGVLVALRLYTRLTIIRKRFWEDASIAIALTFSIVMSLFNQLAVMYGSGRHFETISPPEFVEFLKVGIVVTQVYSLAHFFLKLSILLQYVRVSVTPIDRRLCQGLIVVLCLGYATFIVMRMVRCIPIQAQWTPNLPGGKCFFNSTWFMFASQVWNMVMDFVMLLVPLLVLRHSRAPLLHRVLIGVVLAFGSSKVPWLLLPRPSRLTSPGLASSPSCGFTRCTLLPRRATHRGTRSQALSSASSRSMSASHAQQSSPSAPYFGSCRTGPNGMRIPRPRQQEPLGLGTSQGGGI